MQETEQELTKLRGLELYFSFDDTPARQKYIDELSSTLKQSKATRAELLVEGSVLPQRSEVGYYIWFHIDRLAEANQQRLFVHLRVRPKPASKPPKKIESLKEAGKTVEWLVGRLDGMAERKPITALIDTELVLKGWTRQRLPPLATPLSSDDATLELSGAE